MTITKSKILKLASEHPIIPALAVECQGHDVSEIEAVQNLAEQERQNIQEAMHLLATAQRRKTASGYGTYSIKHWVERLLPGKYVSHAAFVTALLACGFIVRRAEFGTWNGQLSTNISKRTLEEWYRLAYEYSSNRARL